jgi:CBS domain containing-hemolysin-like protein
MEIHKKENTLDPSTKKFDRILDGTMIPETTLLSEVATMLEIEFQRRGRYKTLAAFIMTELGYIPQEGDQLSMFGYTFTVQTRERLRIVGVRINKIVLDGSTGGVTSG